MFDLTDERYLASKAIEVAEDIFRPKQICMWCGQSVYYGSGNFVNRIPSISTYSERLDLGAAYPEGEYICEACDRESETDCV